MIYVLTEWDGKGSGEKTIYKDKAKAMRDRECTLTYNAAVKKYGKSHFRGMDVKCSTIDSYPSEKAMREGRVKTESTWY